jgi:DNA-binding winged helix-turn-helix (wHTH) protein/predicted ATPase
MRPNPVIRFGRYELHPVQGLTRGAQEVRLTPKSLSVLQALARRAGEVVTKDELFGTVWADTAVSDAALTSCIQELRHALSDDARHPRFIETVHRRGYRFLARTSRADQDAPITSPSISSDPLLVGRESIIARLLETYGRAETAVRQVCFVTGEAGVGKTTLVQACLARLAGRGRAHVTWGQCVEHYGVGEPYQPLLEALMRLCRQPGGEAGVAALERFAPTWLAQLPGLLAPAKQAELLRTAAGTTRDRMLRELTNAVEAMTARDPVVLCIEDLHWSDASTLEWIFAFAQRPEPARLLLVGTGRPSNASSEQPFRVLLDSLRVKGFCQEIVLEGLDAAEVAEYAERRFRPGAGQTDALSRLANRVHRHTGGNSLFVVTVFNDLAARRLLVPDGDRWTVRDDLTAIDLGIPDDIRRIIERQVQQLPPEDRALLEIGSVSGTTFVAAVVAAGARLSTDVVERSLTAIARQHRFVQEEGVVEWPDGTVATRFGFGHALFREVLYRMVPAGRRAELHRRIAECQERAYGDRAPEIAAELAMHFDEGREPQRAVQYLQHAAENARRRSAFSEARTHFERALMLLHALPPGPKRAEREVALLIGLGGAIMATRGFGAPDAEAAYSRARAICQQIGDPPRLFPAIWGLWLFYWGRGAVGTADELARELLELAHASGDLSFFLQAHHACWATSFSRGDFAGACASAAAGIRIYDASLHAATAATYGSHDAGVCARMFSARALTFAGRLDEAIRMSDEAIALARSLEHPFSIALALTFRAAMDQSRRDAPAARAHARMAAAVAREQDFRLMLAWCSAIEGWAGLEQGRADASVESIGRAMAAARASGSDQFLPFLLGTMADACLQTGRIDAGLEAVDEALAVAARTGERFYEPELQRLRGELLLGCGAPAYERAEGAFLDAMDLARRQNARLLTLRAAVSLGRLWLRIRKADDARRLVAQARAEITEGLASADVTEADALLAT